jgi:hypothetical protein
MSHGGESISRILARLQRFTMTKKESKDYKQTLFENGQDLMQKQNDRFQEFTAALQKYILNCESPTLDDFIKLSTVGEKYFYQQQITSDAILSGKVDRRTRDDTLVPRIKETVEKSLPAFYEELQKISEKNGFGYKGTLQRKNYESIYSVVEKYARAERS